MAQHIGAPAVASVEVGQSVSKGQEIGSAKGFVSVPVHAPTSGEVVAVESRPHPWGTSLPAVVIKPDGEDSWSTDLQPGDPGSLTVDEIVEKVRLAGVVGMGGAAFPASRRHHADRSFADREAGALDLRPSGQQRLLPRAAARGR